jgi:DNA polymerase-3 subunit gamma/tau
VGRDLLFDLIESVVEEDAPRAFALAERAVESGQDLKLVCRELSRVVRDVMLVSVDPARVGDGELAEGVRERLQQLATRFSREDLMRAFDLLGKAEQEIRTASQPRYYFEMALLRWMHLRKLVPLVDLLTAGAGAGSGAITGRGTRAAAGSASAGPGTVAKPAIAPSAGKAAPARDALVPGKDASAPAKPPAAPAKPPVAPAKDPIAPEKDSIAPARNTNAPLKDTLLGEIRASKGFFYNTVVAQALRIEASGDTVVFTFSPVHKALREQFEQSRAWLEATAERIAGRKVSVLAQTSSAPEPPARSAGDPAPSPPPGARDLKAEAMATPAVQAMLEVFPAEIRDVEEM